MRSPRARATTAVRGGIARDTRTVLFGGARRRRVALRVTLTLMLVAVAAAALLVAARPGLAMVAPPDGAFYTPVVWHHSAAVGEPWDGRLSRGVQLPAEGPDWFTWDPALNRSPDRGWRRWGTDTLVRTLLNTIAAYRAAHPGVPRVGIGDLSRPHGGPFGAVFGGLGHATHQNGLDADVWYPRTDGRERRPRTVAQVDRRAAQRLVDAFLAAGAQKLFVGPHLGLRGPRGIVVPLVHHDDHVHVRIPPPRS
jgi:murein endopeptidase